MQGVVKTGFSKNYGGKIRLEARINKDLKLRMNANGSTRNASDKDYMLDVLKKVRPDIPIYNRVGGKQSSFLPTLFSDLSHHRTYGSRIRRFLNIQL
jgi:hypothetical protein